MLFRSHSCDISQLQAEYDELCEELLTYVNHIHEELKQEMEEFFQNNPQSEIVVKWKGETERRLDNLKTHWQIHAKSHCSHMKSSREALAQVDGMKETHRGQILKHGKHFVSELENVKLNDKQLMEKFDEQWSVWIEERKSHPMLRVVVNVKVDVQTCLLDFKPLKASSLLTAKLEKTPLEKWGHRLHLVFSKKVHLECKWKYFKRLLKKISCKNRIIILILFLLQVFFLIFEKFYSNCFSMLNYFYWDFFHIQQTFKIFPLTL